MEEESAPACCPLLEGSEKEICRPDAQMRPITSWRHSRIHTAAVGEAKKDWDVALEALSRPLNKFFAGRKIVPDAFSIQRVPYQRRQVQIRPCLRRI